MAENTTKAELLAIKRELWRMEMFNNKLKPVKRFGKFAVKERECPIDGLAELGLCYESAYGDITITRVKENEELTIPVKYQYWFDVNMLTRRDMQTLMKDVRLYIDNYFLVLAGFRQRLNIIQ